MLSLLTTDEAVGAFDEAAAMITHQMPTPNSQLPTRGK